MSENSIHPAGILCLQSYQLGKKDQERLADALQQRALHACPDPALTVPGTAVLWMGVPVDAIAEQNNVSVQPTTCRLTCTLIRILHIPLNPIRSTLVISGCFNSWFTCCRRIKFE